MRQHLGSGYEFPRHKVRTIVQNKRAQFRYTGYTAPRMGELHETHASSVVKNGRIINIMNIATSWDM